MLWALHYLQNVPTGQSVLSWQRLALPLGQRRLKRPRGAGRCTCEAICCLPEISAHLARTAGLSALGVLEIVHQILVLNIFGTAPVSFADSGAIIAVDEAINAFTGTRRQIG